MVKAGFGLQTIPWMSSVCMEWPGRWGGFLTGIFRGPAPSGACGEGEVARLWEGGSLLKAQIPAILVAWGLSVLGTFVILKSWMPASAYA